MRIWGSVGWIGGFSEGVGNGSVMGCVAGSWQAMDSGSGGGSGEVRASTSYWWGSVPCGGAHLPLVLVRSTKIYKTPMLLSV